MNDGEGRSVNMLVNLEKLVVAPWIRIALYPWAIPTCISNGFLYASQLLACTGILVRIKFWPPNFDKILLLRKKWEKIVAIKIAMCMEIRLYEFSMLLFVFL